MTIKDCVGSSSAPVTIRNDTRGSGPTIIRRTSGSSGFVFLCWNCKHIVVDGMGKWSGAPAGTCGVVGKWALGRSQCGIKVTIASGQPPTAFLSFYGSSSSFTVRGVEIDGEYPTAGVSADGKGMGLSVNDDTYKLAQHPGEWRENIKIHNNYVHDLGSECLYVGPNYSSGGTVIGSLPLRNVQIYNNIVERCVRDGINLKSTISGTNPVHHNYLQDIGIGVGYGSTDRSAIQVFEGYAHIYNNRIRNVYLRSQTGGHCIHLYVMNRPSSFVFPLSLIYNNLCISPEVDGISVGRSSTSNALPWPVIYSNTIIRPRGNGIEVNNRITKGTVRDNIIAESSQEAIKNYSGAVVVNNREGSVSSLRFVNPSAHDYRLQSASPAVNKGSATGYPPVDHDDQYRPVSSMPDQGAYEYR